MTKIEGVWDTVLSGPVPLGREGKHIGAKGKRQYERAWRVYRERQAELVSIWADQTADDSKEEGHERRS